MKLVPKFQRGGLYVGQSGFYRQPQSNAILDFVSDAINKIKNVDLNVADESGYSKQLKAKNPQYFSKPSNKEQPKKQTPKQNVQYDKKTDTFNGGSKKEITVTASRLKPRNQVNTSTKQEGKPQTPTKSTTTVKPKETLEGLENGNITKSKQTYLKPKGEVNQKVVDWQNKLKAEGFDLGKVDGIWGKKTEAAYQAYLKNKERLEKVGLPEDNAPFIEARQGFPTPESVYLKQGGEMEFIYLQKGGKINGKSAPKDNDENAIPTKEEGGTDMNPKFTKKLKPKQTAKPSPIYKPKTKTEKVEEKKKGGKMRKKCSCGCAMKISKNAKGGLIESCACGCKTKK